MGIINALRAIAANAGTISPALGEEALAALKDYEAHIAKIAATWPPGLDLPTCLDCCNFSDDAPDGFCKLAEHPDVIQFCSNPESYSVADMSRCPGFVRDGS